MPPRPAKPIHHETPTNGADPFGPDNFDADLPLRFTRGELELRWRRAPPLLQWADGVAPRGAKATYSTAQFFEI